MWLTVVLLLAPVVVGRVTREDFAALHALETTGDTSKISAASQLALLESFLELDNSWFWSRRRRRSSSSYSPPPPPPPRRRHSPCECDVPEQDSFTNECLSRRFQSLMSVYDGLLSPTSEDFTIESSRVELREPQIQLETTFTDLHGNTTELIFNITDPQVGLLHRADRATKKLLSMEYFWASSVNNAWMNLLSVTNNKFAVSVEGMLTTQDGLMGEMSAWFSGLQQDQEDATLANIQNVFTTIVPIITDHVADMNAQLRRVWESLNNVNSSLSNATQNSDEVNAGFRRSLDSISRSLYNISMIDLPNAVTLYGTKMNTSLWSAATSYNQTATAIVSGYKSVSKSKKDGFVESSNSTINSRISALRLLLSNTYQSLSDSITNASTAANASIDATWSKYFGPAVDAVSVKVTNATSQLTSDVASNRGLLNLNSQEQSRLDSFFTNISSTETQLVSSSRSSSSGAVSNTNREMNEIIGMTASRSAKDLELTNALGLAAPAAVGSETFSNLNEMSDQVNSMDSQLADFARSAAAESQAANAALGESTRTGNQAVNDAGTEIAGQIGENAGNAFTNTNEVGNEMGEGQTTVPTSAAISTLTSAQAAALAAVQAEMNSRVASGTLGNQADAETMTSEILLTLQQQGVSAEDALVALRAYIASAGDTNAYSASFASQTDDSIGTFLSGAASGVYETEVTFTNNMQSAFDNFKRNLTVPGTGTSSADYAADEVEKAKENFDRSSGSTANDGTSSSLNTDKLDQDVDEQTRSVQGQVGDRVAEGRTDIDSFLASASSTASDTTANQMRELASADASSEISIGELDVDQMSQIRSIAANFDSLMRLVNDHIGSQNVPLYNAIVNLPTKGQSMMQEIRAFNAAAYAIQRGDPLGMDDLAKFGINPDPDISDLSSRVSQTAENDFGEISKISAFFNNSANNYWNDFAVLSNSFSSTFEALVKGLQANLAAADAAAKSEAPNVVRDGGVLSAISRISSQIQNLAEKANEIVGNGLSVPYTEMTDLMSKSAAVIANASDSASRASEIVETVSRESQGMSQQISALNNTGSVSELKLHAAALAMQSGVLLNQLNNRDANMNETGSDTMRVIASYANEAAASASVIAQRGDSVSNAVLLAQANILNSMAKIAENTVSLDVAPATDLTVLRATVAQMIAIFDSFLANQRLRFTAARSELNSTNANSLFNAKQKLTGLDMDLGSQKTMIANHINDLQTAISWLGNDADLKVPADALRAQIEDWYNRGMKDIEGEESELKGVSLDTSSTVQTVESSLSSAIEDMAAQAVSMIQSYKLPVPNKLEDYASIGIEAIAR